MNRNGLDEGQGVWGVALHSKPGGNVKIERKQIVRTEERKAKLEEGTN